MSFAMSGRAPQAREALAARGVAASIAAFLARRNWSWLGSAAGLLVFALVAAGLYRLAGEVAWTDIRSAAQSLGWAQILGAALATAVSYAALTFLDILSLRQVGVRQVPWPYAALTSFISHSLTFTLGFGVLTGGAVRLRRYQLKGVEAGRIIASGVLCALTFWMGLAAAAGICLVAAPGIFAHLFGMPPSMAMAIGGVILAALGGWIAYAASRSAAITISGWEISLPGPAFSLGAVAIGIADTSSAALALWLLLPADIPVTFPSFLEIFVLATVAGVISHVPGGLGVFEAILFLALPGMSTPQGIGALLMFRLVYYVAPFVLSAMALLAQEVRSRSAAIDKARRALSKTAGPFLLPACSIAVFTGGLVLLISGATPADHARMFVLRSVVPLPFVETSHFVASLVGAVLLVIGYGLTQRLRSAWTTAVALLAAGALFSLVKGIDYEEALVCLAIILLLWLARPEFYRRAGLLDTPVSSGWLLAIGIGLAASVWVGFAAYSTASCKQWVWWNFAYNGDAPRFLRATLGIGIVALLLGLHRALHSVHPGIAGEEGDLARVRPIVATAQQTDAHLALLGDKRFLFTEDGEGFLMYGVQGSTWLAMGDPVTADEKRAIELIWRFKELADLHNGAPAFYQLSSRYIACYIDAGFSLAKLGEDAVVELSGFTLEGGEWRKWRQAKAGAERRGLSFRIVPAEHIPPFLPLLKEVSDAWIAERGRKEKGFSLGFWSQAYLRRYDHAIVCMGDRVVAFANIWKAAQQSEYSVDLMRHLPDAPAGTMDYLFICLMMAAKADGFQWFNLGMAPLSGLASHRLASRWSRLGALIHRHGDSYYNFEGLRAFKSKFKPVWRPRYLAHPGGLSMARVLMDATRLIGASPKRVLKSEGIFRT
jgi:phosphatidylglycerol lysyltransferase